MRYIKNVVSVVSITLFFHRKNTEGHSCELDTVDDFENAKQLIPAELY